ncbi:MAG: hypothetical protein RLY17_692 [Pseudomonadota bacterium]|jgi:hypothetical protein
MPGTNIFENGIFRFNQADGRVFNVVNDITIHNAHAR